MERKEFLEDKVPEAKPNIEVEDIVKIVREELLKASSGFIGLDNTEENIEALKKKIGEALTLILTQHAGTTPAEIARLMEILRQQEDNVRNPFLMPRPQFPNPFDNNPFGDRVYGPTTYPTPGFERYDSTPNPFRIIGGQTFTTGGATGEDGTGGSIGGGTQQGISAFEHVDYNTFNASMPVRPIGPENIGNLIGQTPGTITTAQAAILIGESLRAASNRPV